MSVYAGEFYGAVVSFSRIFFVLSMASFRTVAIGKSIIDKIDLVSVARTESSQKVGAFHISMDVLRLVEELQSVELSECV